MAIWVYETSIFIVLLRIFSSLLHIFRRSIQWQFCPEKCKPHFYRSNGMHTCITAPFLFNQSVNHIRRSKELYIIFWFISIMILKGYLKEDFLFITYCLLEAMVFWLFFQFAHVLIQAFNCYSALVYVYLVLPRF